MVRLVAGPGAAQQLFGGVTVTEAERRQSTSRGGTFEKIAT
jgi:hypothetical protein